MTTPAAVEIVIEAVQYTPDRDPVLIQYAGKGVTSGPFAQSQLHHTTQVALSERSGNPGYWSDAETKAELADHLAEHGIAAVIVSNALPESVAASDDVAPPAPANVATT